MIKTTLGDLMNAEEALAFVETQVVPARTAYEIGRLIRLVTVETAHFKKEREALMRRLGLERPSTPEERLRGATATVITVSAEHWPEYVRQLEELAAVPVDIDAKPIRLESVPNLRPSDVRTLGNLLIDDGSP
jgi:hypothetical protein